MIISKTHHHACWHFIIIDVLVERLIKEPFELLVIFNSYASSSLTLLHPHNSPPATTSFLKAWFCGVEGDVNTFLFWLPGEEWKRSPEVQSSWRENKFTKQNFLCAFSDTLPDKLTVLGTPGSELQDIQKMIDRLQNSLDPREVSQLPAIHREVIFLQFNAAIRHLLQ